MPQPDGTGGCLTEAERRANMLIECLGALDSNQVLDSGWGPLSPYIYVLEPPPAIDSCETPSTDFNGDAGWTDCEIEDVCQNEIMSVVRAPDFNGPDGWTDPCDDPGVCAGSSIAGIDASAVPNLAEFIGSLSELVVAPAFGEDGADSRIVLTSRPFRGDPALVDR